MSLFIALQLCWGAVKAEPLQKVTILGTDVDTLLEAPGKGPFVDFIQDLGKRINIEFTIRIVPGKRAISLYENEDYLAWFPIHLFYVDDLNAVNKPSVGSLPILTLKWGVFGAPGSAPFSSFEALAGKRVGLSQGYMYHPKVEADQAMVKILNPNEKRNILMLLRGRLDATIMYPHDLERMRQELGVPPLVFSPAADVGSTDLGIMFPDTVTGRALRDRVNVGMKQMWQEGVLPLNLIVPPNGAEQ